MCGETDRTVLQIDHRYPILRKQTDWIGHHAALYRKMRDRDSSPFLVQVLCANCHHRKSTMERWMLGAKPGAL